MKTTIPTWCLRNLAPVRTRFDARTTSKSRNVSLVAHVLSSRALRVLWLAHRRGFSSCHSLLWRIDSLVVNLIVSLVNLALEAFCRKVNTRWFIDSAHLCCFVLADEQERVQKKTFTNWCNSYLRMVSLKPDLANVSGKGHSVQTISLPQRKGAGREF